MSARTEGGHIQRHRAAALAQWKRLGEALGDPQLCAQVDAAGEAVLAALDAGRTLIVIGNGGSAAMASHVAAEFAGKCIQDRDPLPAIALSDSSTAVTAVGNDYGFEQIFVRGIRAFGRAGDVVIAMSTSGTSANIVSALAEARAAGLVTIAMTGERGGGLAHLVDHLLIVPSEETPRIQEVHLLWSHGWCEAVDMAWHDAR